MSPTRALARPLLASVFVSAGIDALRNPQPRIEKAEAAGLTDADRLVRINAATMVGAGLMLGTGKLPRLSALVLAGALVPTTYVGHPFWTESDPQAKKQQRLHFLKNAGILGGLLATVADTGGRESVPHAIHRVTEETTGKIVKTKDDTAERFTKAARKAEKRARKAEKRAHKRLDSRSHSRFPLAS